MNSIYTLAGRGCDYLYDPLPDVSFQRGDVVFLFGNLLITHADSFHEVVIGLMRLVQNRIGVLQL